MDPSHRRHAAVAVYMAFLGGLVFATFSDFREFLPALLRGGIVTVEVFAGSLVVFYVCACAAGLARISNLAPVRWVATIYVELFRGTSLLVQLFWFFFVLPEFGIQMTPMVTAVVVLGLNFGAFGAEVVRGAILSVPQGQWEAATALNLTPVRRMMDVVLPQAMIVMVPAVGNLTVELVKSTSLVSAVTLVDITFASVQQNQLHYRTAEIFVTALILYYCLAQIIRFTLAIVEGYIIRHIPVRSAP